MQKRDKKCDVFISHAVEDQESFVRKLAVTLIERTFAWLNQFRRLRLRYDPRLPNRQAASEKIEVRFFS